MLSSASRSSLRCRAAHFCASTAAGLAVASAWLVGKGILEPPGERGDAKEAGREERRAGEPAWETPEARAPERRGLRPLARDAGRLADMLLVKRRPVLDAVGML